MAHPPADAEPAGSTSAPARSTPKGRPWGCDIPKITAPFSTPSLYTVHLTKEVQTLLIKG